MILNVSHVARRINDLAETQGDQENFYKILSWEFAQNEVCSIILSFTSLFSFLRTNIWPHSSSNCDHVAEQLITIISNGN